MTELGDKLKAARTEKGLSLDDLQQVTKIQKRYLEAIEQGNYSVMPGKFYARAFIKQYAEAVDLDSEALFNEFETEVPKTQQEGPEQEQRRARKKASSLAAHSVGGSGHGRHRLFDILPKVLIVLFILFILFIIWYFVFASGGSNDSATKNKNSDSKVNLQDDTNSSSTKKSNSKSDEEKKKADKDKKEDEEKKKESDKKTEITKGETSGNTTTYTVKNADKLSVQVSAEDAASWIGISGKSGNSLYNKTLNAGDSSGSIDAGSESTISIVIGNAPATTVKINDEKIELDSSPVKQVLTINLEKDEDTSSDTN
ncbi:RodZ domain-containing protein [Listeria sp. PSOL-1]|uniref:helix-turn-helix domain-containing protein n=1 Tax=Listeria sp. PSOL-1 TaxID=1844999 RepID=UPI0013D59FB2|nr:RodZ domain-containing protein [Listeria sp. PSOL-1]